MSEQNSISEDLAKYCETQGIGHLGVLLFAHRFPNDENDKPTPNSIVFMDTTIGENHRVLSGQTTCQSEFACVYARTSTEKEGRDILGSIKTLLEESIKRVILGNSFYMSVLSANPIHFVGTDKNKKVLSELRLTIMRRPK